MNTCPTCYQHVIESCIQTIYIKSSTIGYGEYTAVVTDKFGNVFVAYAASTGGLTSIDLSQFPPYLFNPYGGTLQIQLYGNNCNPIALMFCGIEYTCISIKVVNVIGNDGSDNSAFIPCCKGDDSTPTLPEPPNEYPPKVDPPPPPPKKDPPTTPQTGTSYTTTGGSPPASDNEQSN